MGRTNARSPQIPVGVHHDQINIVHQHTGRITHTTGWIVVRLQDNHKYE